MALSYKEFKGMHKQAWDLPASANSYYQYGLNNGKTEAELMTYNPEGAKKNFKESLDPFRNAGIGMWNGAGWLGKMEEKAVNAIPTMTGAALYTLTEPYYRLKALGSDKSYKQLRDEYYEKADDVWDDYIPGKILQGLKYPGQKLQEWNGMVNDYWDRPRDHEDTPAARYNQFF